MSGLSERMPHVLSFPGALGTGIIVRLGDGSNVNSLRPDHANDAHNSTKRNDATAATATSPVKQSDLHANITALINEYESVLSRFRDDSLITAMGRATNGGAFDFPDWTAGLFDLYDALCDATDGAIDPCIGEDLIRLGYDAQYSFTLEPDANARLGAVHGRPTWRNDVKRTGTTLITRRAVHLDVGACGKGYLVDLIAELVDRHYGRHPSIRYHEPAIRDSGRTAHDHMHIDQRESSPINASDTGRQPAGTSPELLIDAGGDLLIRSAQPVTIALEDPTDTTNAVGTASLSAGSFCASAPSRRHWQASGQLALHHLLNAIDGQPVRDVAAAWVAVNQSSISQASTDHPTALADGLATALFVAEPNMLAARFPFACAVLYPDRTATVSRNFPGQLFIRR